MRGTIIQIMWGLPLLLLIPNTQASSEELRLHAKFSERGYSNMMRPVKQYNTTTQLSLDIIFRRIDNMDEKKQLLSTSMWVRVYWESEIHRWDPKEYGGLEEIFYSSSEIWVPDLVLYNSAVEPPLFASIETPVNVNFNGTVKWTTPFTATSTCRLDMTYYPFDHQNCEFTFGLWTKNENQVNISLPKGNYAPDITMLLRSGSFNIIRISANRFNPQYEQNNRNYSYPNVKYVMHIQRRTQYYVKGIVAPSLLLGALGVITFLLPAACGERVGFCVTLLLALMVLLLVVAEQIPETSDSYPIIARFLELMLLSLTAALFISSLTLKFLFHQTQRVDDIPWFIRVFTNQWLSVLMLVDWNCRKTNSNLKNHRQENGKQVYQLMSSEESSSAQLQRIVQHIDDTNETEVCNKEYRKAAKVWDRLCILLYLGMMAGIYMWLTISAPKYNTP